MAFKGLFVGVDRYRFPEVGWLSCAKRDAVAMHAIFADNLGGASTILFDEDATKSTVETALEALTSCSEDDSVVVYFSGHGTETHELVVHDTTVLDIENTSISLEELRKFFERIPARRLLLVLDCCFSGGMGAKVLQVESVPRDPRSVGAELDLLGGEGRIILTASSPTQEAYENPRLGHGFLTQQLLAALEGPEEIVEGGQIGVFRLLEWVSRGVSTAARQAGREQDPSIRGTFEGELVWPVFRRGPLYSAAFPDRGRPDAAADLESLAAFGLPPEIIQVWQTEIPTLNALQVGAINEFGILAGEHVLVSAPTSSGKTMLGELAAIKGVSERRRALFLFPLKALVADKLRQFERLYGPQGIRTIEATGETDDVGPLLRGQYDIALLTYEKFANLALTYPHILNQVGTIVIDEVQMIADLGRGANLEFLFTLLQMHRRRGVEPQLIALSAVIGDTRGFERWLGGRLLRRTDRPVPLDEGLLLRDGRFRFVDGDTGAERTEQMIQPEFSEGKSRDWVIPLVRRLVQEGKQVIVFRETTGETRHCARYLAEALDLPPATVALDQMPAGDLSQASQELRASLQHGIAFHNSHLDRDERRIIEEQFRAADGSLRVIAATTTLAMGVNTPASSVVIVGLEHPGEQPYSVAEYKNLAGRAGRLGYAERGSSFLLATEGLAENDLWHRYVQAAPEDLTSRFLESDPRTLIMRVVVASQRTGGMTADEIVAFLESSFGAFLRQREQNNWTWNRESFEQNTASLITHGLIVADGEGLLSPTSLGRLAGESALEIETIIRLISGLRRASPAELSDPALLAIAQTSVELDQVYFPMNRRAIHKEPAAWTAELTRQGVSHGVLAALNSNVTDQMQGTLRAKKAVSCLYYVSETDLNEIERAMTQFGGAFDGAAGPIRGVASRTCDILPTVGRVAELMNPDLKIGERIERLVVRLEYGIHADGVDLARHTGRGLTRAEYRSLRQGGLTTGSAIADADDAQLLPHVGGSTDKLAALRAAAHLLQTAAAAARPITPLVAYEG